MDWVKALSPKLGSISSVSEKKLGSLWAGYGFVSRLIVKPQQQSYIAKQVRPPPNGKGVGHERKVHSYEVECSWYSGPAQYAASAGVNIPLPVLVEKDGSGFTIVLKDLEPDFPNKSMKGAMGVKELKPGRSMPCLADELAGTFWHLGTRMEEFDSMDSDDWLRDKAHEIDARLRGFSSFAALQAGETPSNQHQTLVHGDFKAANLLFSSNSTEAAAYDFQYVGRGLGALDVAYLIICSSSLPVVEQSEDELLAHYHHHLMSCLDARGQSDKSYTMEVLRWGAIPSSRGDEYARKIGARVFGKHL